MLSAFKQLPGPLQKQVLIRLGLGALFFVLMLALLIPARDILIWLPCAGAAVFFAAAAFLLFRRAVLGDYVIVSGECREVIVTAVKRRVKQIILRADGQDLQVTVRGRLRKITAGATVDLYLAANAPVFEKGNTLILYNYLALDIKQTGRGQHV